MSNNTTAAEVSTGLTKEQKQKARRIFSECPVAALPGFFAPVNVDTVEDVLTITEGIIRTLRDEMAELIETKEELDKLKRDLKTAGRVFKLMTSEDE